MSRRRWILVGGTAAVAVSIAAAETGADLAGWGWLALSALVGTGAAFVLARVVERRPPAAPPSTARLVLLAGIGAGSVPFWEDLVQGTAAIVFVGVAASFLVTLFVRYRGLDADPLPEPESH